MEITVAVQAEMAGQSTILLLQHHFAKQIFLMFIRFLQIMPVLFITWANLINGAFTDASLIASAILNYTVNGVAQPGILMTNLADSTFSGTIPTVLFNGDSIAAGDTICYNIEVTDGSFCANINYLPGHGPSDVQCSTFKLGFHFHIVITLILPQICGHPAV